MTRFLLSVGLPSRRRTSRVVEEAKVVHPHLSRAPRVPETTQTVVTVTTFPLKSISFHDISINKDVCRDKGDIRLHTCVSDVGPSRSVLMVARCTLFVVSVTTLSYVLCLSHLLIRSFFPLQGNQLLAEFLSAVAKLFEMTEQAHYWCYWNYTWRANVWRTLAQKHK